MPELNWEGQHIINIPVGETKRFGKMSFATLYEGLYKFRLI